MPASGQDLIDLLRESAAPVAIVAGAVVLLIGAVVWIRRRLQGHEDHTALDQAMLSQIGELHRQGDLSDEEYRSIKGRLVQRLDASLRERGPDGSWRS
ncbi:MAG: hypothetical protein ACREJB_06990 [Planctomycetaceae bacterium]